MSDELPGMLELQRRVKERVWPHTIDPRLWAKEWLKTIALHPEIATDEGAMISWFSNAIMAGYDTATMRLSERRGDEQD